jgi:hypothetical protein
MLNMHSPIETFIEDNKVARFAGKIYETVPFSNLLKYRSTKIIIVQFIYLIRKFNFILYFHIILDIPKYKIHIAKEISF